MLRWTVTASGEEQTGAGVTRGETVSATFTVTAPEDAPFYNPYRRNVHPFRANGDVYGVVRYEVDGVPFEITVDSAEIIGVLPDVSLRVTPDNLVLNTLSDTEELTVSVAATSYSTEPASTTVFVDAPDGWIVEPESVDLEFANKGAAAGATFTLTPPEGLPEGSYDFTVRAEGELESTDYVQLIDYEHIGRTYLVTPAVANLQSLQVAFDPNIRIGYVDGGSDLVFEGLRRIGMNVDLMTEDDLTTGDLNDFDTIIVGIYAYRTRPDLLATNARLLNWVENGGNLVVTYHRPVDAWDPESVPPAFLDLGRVSILSRVTDAAAPVEFLAPELDLQLFRDATGHRGRGDAARLGAADATPLRPPPHLQGDLGKLRGLSRSGVAAHDHHLMLAQAGADVLTPPRDGKVFWKGKVQGVALMPASGGGCKKRSSGVIALPTIKENGPGDPFYEISARHTKQ